jgi:hypothetical protein
MKTRGSLTSLSACALTAILLLVVLCGGSGPVFAGTQANDLSLGTSDFSKGLRMAATQPLPDTLPGMTLRVPLKRGEAGLGALPLPLAVPFRPYRRLTGIHLFRGGPAAITDGFGSILRGLGYLGGTPRLMWITRPEASVGLPVTDSLGTILAALGYGLPAGIEMEWQDLFPVTRSMGAMLAGLGYEPRGGVQHGAVRTATSNPPVTRSMASILTGLGYGRHGRRSAASASLRHARVGR